MINKPSSYGTIYSRERQPLIFTSFLFPYDFSEQFNLNALAIDRSFMAPQQDNDVAKLDNLSIQSASLEQIIRYPIYDHPWVEEFYIGGLGVLSGSLNTVIAYKTHDQVNPEEFRIAGLNITSASLTVVVNYVNYTTQENEERTELGGLSITSASLNLI